jgi:hypothetical protein
MGTLLRDLYGPDIWIQSLFQHFDDKQKWIVTDVRFKNEAEFIKKNGGVLIRVEGDPSGLRARMPLDKQQHISETDLDDYADFDLVIQNDIVGFNPLYATIQNVCKFK